MINYDNKILNKLNNWHDDTIHIIADFDRTLTVGTSESSWGILSSGNFVQEEYKKERQKLYEFYRPIEIDETMDFETKNKLMIEWWTAHISLFIKYQLTEDVIIDAVKDIKVLKFREGAIELLKRLKEKNIPLLIISAGIGNIIVEFLKNNNCYFDNIHIISNFIKFENGIAVGLEDNIIHSLNKNEALLPDNIKHVIENRPNVILLGDQVADTKMVDDEVKSVVKIGFCEENADENYKYFKKVYDVVCTDNTTFYELSDELNILK